MAASDQPDERWTSAARPAEPVRAQTAWRLSVVVPVYNEETTLAALLARLVPAVERITPGYELIFVNDGSTDRTAMLLEAASHDDPRIKVVNLTRNFGKEAALTAGLAYATGDAIVPLDADLQDPPELMAELVAKWREGYDMVVAVRRDRSSEPVARRRSAALFYRVIGRLSDVPIPANAGDFRLLDRRVVDALMRLPERTRFMKGMFAWLGFRQAVITYVRPARVAGESKWRPWRLWNFALEGIFSFTTLPLRIWTYFGAFLGIGALVYMIVVVVRTALYGVEVPGYASLVALLLFFSGMNMIGLGMLGEYVGRIFVEVKQRPLYLVRDTTGFDRPRGGSLGEAPDSSRDQRGSVRRSA
jgi:glycosyltransferase involved in cell wall biosynthesis